MPATTMPKDPQYVLNHCAKYLARTNAEPRHDYGGEYAGQDRARISECWRFPIMDSHDDTEPRAYDYNDVTFVYCEPRGQAPAGSVELICTASHLWSAVPLERVSGTRYWSCTLVTPKGQRHYYRFVIDGKSTLDSINPQTLMRDDGSTWSSFFTWACTEPVSFERWELCILDRLTRHILPFNSAEAENFLKRGASEGTSAHLYRLDTSVGASNYIDKIVAREERHHLQTYKTCVELIDTVLHARNPFVDSAQMEESMFIKLYDDMGVMTNRDNAGYAEVKSALEREGWDFSRYDNPGYFLNVLRRHTITGAFAHPKYGGNAGGMGWAWLSDKFRDDDGKTLFDWGRAVESPLGRNTEYWG
jgi:hypothetical protein